MDYTAGYNAAAQPLHHHQAYDPAAQPVHQYQGYDPSAQPVHQYQGYDPSAQPHQFYNQPAEDYYSYPYSNPQYATTDPYPYHGLNAQPPQHGEQEPNPPGVSVQPPPQHDPNAYYHGYCAATAYTVDAGVAAVNQPIMQPSYNTIGTTNGVAHPGIAQNHPGPIHNFSAHSYCGRGHGHGRGRGRSLHKRQDKRAFTQVGPSQPIPYGPSLGPTPAPSPAQAQSAPSKHLWCELCKVECNSLEILNRHNSGKKHMKNLKAANQQLPQESSLPSQLPQDINGVEKRKDEEGKGKALWCELCKANCNTIEIFNKHLNGKKHLKKMKTSIQIGVQTEQVSGTNLKPPDQGSLPSQEINEESKVGESKRKMRGGKVIRSVRSKRSMEPQAKEVVPLMCELCNIKCESQVVFQSHIVGKKHLMKAKRFLSENEELGQEVFQILKHAVQTFQGQNASASSTSFMGSQLDHCHQGLLLGQPMNFQTPALETNLGSACVEDTSQVQVPLAEFVGGPVMANGEGIPNEGQSETGHLVSS